MRFLYLVTPVALLSLAASGQPGGANTPTLPPLLAFPIRDVPLSAEAVIEHTIRGADGTLKTNTIKGIIYRDSSGRIRWEYAEPLPQLQAVQPTLYQIFDPADRGSNIFVEPSSKRAHRFKFPKTAGPMSPPVGLVGGRIFEEKGEKKFTTEQLGAKVIDGIQFEGSRTTTTVVERPSLIGINERWFSSTLGLIGVTKLSGLGEEETIQLGLAPIFDTTS